AWIIWGIATPAQALDGFSSLNWIFVVSVLGIATAIARSGLLFRAGLLLVRRMPPGLFWQAGTLLLTGVLLSPLLPQNQGRAALFLVLRPGRPAAPSRERVAVQMAVLGPPTGHEIAMLVVLGLTVVGFVVGPGLGLNPGTTAILGFIGAVISGNFDRRALQE